MNWQHAYTVVAELTGISSLSLGVSYSQHLTQVLPLVGVISLVYTILRSTKFYRRHTRALLLGVILPLIGNLWYLFLIAFRTMTARKQAEEVALRESEQRYRELYVKAQRQMHELSLLNQVRTTLAREMDLPTILHDVVEATAKTFGYTLVSLYLRQDDELVLQHQVGYERVIERLPITEGVCGQVTRTGEPVLLRDVRTDPAFLEAAPNIASEVCVPLLDQGQVVGTLNVESNDPTALTEADLALLVGLAEHINIAIERVRLYAQLRERERHLAELVEARTAALRESESRFKAIYHTANVLIVAHDMAGNVIYINPYACRTLGYQAEELLGQRIRLLLEESEIQKARPLTAKLMTDPDFQVEGFEQYLLKKEGQRVLISWNVTALRDALGNVTAILGIGQDITVRKQMEAELARYRDHLEELVIMRTAELQASQALLDLFFSQSLDGFFIMMLDEPVRWDDTVDKESVLDYVFAHQRITRANDAILAQYGAPYEQFLGRTPNDFFAHDLAHGKAVWRNFFDAGHLHTDTDERKLDGAPMWIEGDYVCIYDDRGYIAGHFGVQREVTEQRRVVHALQDRERFLAVLNDITRAALDTPDLPAMLQILADRLGELFNADGAYLTLWDASAQRTIPAAAYGPMRDAYPRSRSIPGEVTMTESVLCAGRPLVAEDVMNTPYLSPHIAAKYPTRSLLALPLIVGERKLGAALIAFNTPHRFTEEEIQRAEQTARQIALAVARACLYQKLQTYAEQLEQQVRARTAELQAQYAQLDAILRSVDDVIFMTDPAQRILYVNPAFTTLTGYTKEEVLGQDVSTLQALVDFAPRSRSVMPTLTKGQLWHGEVLARRKDGRSYDAALAIAPVHDEPGQIIGHVFNCRDISQAKNLERARNQFIANVSHQFRTPVTTLKLSVYLMQRTTQSKEHQRQLRAMELRINWLIQLIEDTLEISTLDSGKGVDAWEFVSLPGIVTEVLRRYQDQASSAGLTLTAVPAPPALPTVRGDTARLAQALGEVVENAVVFTPPGGQVAVAVQPQTVDGVEWITIAVQDSGPGIAAEELPRVFERFFRGSLAESGHTAGTGLGLSIAEMIAQAHGGRITVESTIGKGSTFMLWLRSAFQEEESQDETREI